jgi:hypothetical protein
VTRSPSPEPVQRLGGHAPASVWLPLVALAALAAALRLYRLDGQLWLDEIYTIQLVRLGPWAIWLNMAADPHPPLFYLSEWLASGFGLALLGTLTIAGGSYNLARYWTMPKSPEAALVATLRAQAQSEDVAISLHYSTSAALSFYAPALTVYSRPERGPDGTRLARTAQIVAVAELTPPSDVPVGQIIRPGARAWLLFHTNQPLPTPFDTLVARCAQPAAIDYPPFRALLLADCP